MGLKFLPLLSIFSMSSNIDTSTVCLHLPQSMSSTYLQRHIINTYQWGLRQERLSCKKIYIRSVRGFSGHGLLQGGRVSLSFVPESHELLSSCPWCMGRVFIVFLCPVTCFPMICPAIEPFVFFLETTLNIYPCLPFAIKIAVF